MTRTVKMAASLVGSLWYEVAAALKKVADAESVPLGTAKTRIRQAMIRLRDQLSGLQINEEAP